ncbi:MAG: nucleotidyltransferase domain-containing protein [Candidatus Woesearchaeota archaeon]
MTLLKIIAQPEIRRLFGKRELVIIRKQLLGVPLKSSEKTRLSRDIRKKFEAITLLIPLAQEFELKKGAEIKRLIEKAKEIILETKFFPRIKKIILFGSVAENKPTLLSDIDLAVEFTSLAEGEATLFRREVLGQLNERFDVQVYNQLPTKIKKEIDEKGKVIYERTH